MTTRKDFLAAASAAAALLPIVADAAPAKGHLDDEIPPFQFNRARFEAITAQDAAHRHVFAARKLAKGDVLDAMNNTYNAYTMGLAETKPSVLMAAVLYHGAAVGLGFDDRVWNALLIPSLPKLPKSIRSDVGAIKAGSGNPYLHKGKGASPFDTSVEKMTEAGSYFFVCNNATMGMASALAPIFGRGEADIYAELAKGLVPNAMLVPAGVWAVHALQEAKFTYLQTT